MWNEKVKVDVSKHLPANESIYSELKEIRKQIRKPMMTKTIDSKAYKYLMRGLITVNDEYYDVHHLPHTSIDYVVEIYELDGKYEYRCNCQGYKANGYCCHSLAILILRVISGFDNIKDLQEYCEKLKR